MGAPSNANDQFKQTSRAAVGLGCMLALTAHFAIFNVFPSVRIAEASTARAELAALELPPTVSIPEPPRPVARPARPVIAQLSLPEDLTIAPTTFDRFEPVAETAIAPPSVETASETQRPRYIPYEVAPRLINRNETIELLQKVYPTALKNAGVGGSVRLWLYVDERGLVQDCQVDVSSGFEALDAAATTVAHGMRFTPALMRDKPAAVWISQPIDFISN